MAPTFQPPPELQPAKRTRSADEAEELARPPKSARTKEKDKVNQLRRISIRNRLMFAFKQLLPTERRLTHSCNDASTTSILRSAQFFLSVLNFFTFLPPLESQQVVHDAALVDRLLPSGLVISSLSYSSSFLLASSHLRPLCPPSSLSIILNQYRPKRTPSDTPADLRNPCPDPFSTGGSPEHRPRMWL